MFKHSKSDLSHSIRPQTLLREPLPVDFFRFRLYASRVRILDMQCFHRPKVHNFCLDVSSETLAALFAFGPIPLFPRLKSLTYVSFAQGVGEMTFTSTLDDVRLRVSEIYSTISTTWRLRVAVSQSCASRWIIGTQDIAATLHLGQISRACFSDFLISCLCSLRIWILLLLACGS